MPPFVNVDDFQQAARRHLPRIFADYIDGGAFSETTMRRNRADFDRYAIRQRVLEPLEQTADLSVSTLGRRSALPFGPGPVGFLGLYRRDGDIRVARAAAKADIPFVLSTFSINGLETIRKNCGHTPDFQLYLDRDPQVNESHLASCREQGVERIFLTVDTAITSVRERDVRNGFRATDRMTPQLLWQFAKRPFWSLDLLRGGFPDVELVKGRPEFGKGALAQASKLSARLEKNLTWETVAELRRQWEGKLILKGVSDPADAELAARAGVDGIVLSNHGGRQLDHATSTFARLRDVRAALGPDLALYIDSGFRRGTDVVKALALGADFILMGRPFAWAVAADGERGVTQLVTLLREEIAITLNLAGLSSVAELKKAGASALIDLSDKDA